MQYIIISLHTKYDYFSLHSFTEIFDEKFHHSKYEKKENWTNTGKNKQEKAGLQSHNTYSSLHSFAEIFDEKFHHAKYGMKKNWTKTGNNKQVKAGLQSHDTIHHYQPTYQI